MADQQKIEDTSKLTKPFDYLSFDVVKECWNRYKLNDGSILKSKFILINILGVKDFKERIKKTQADKQTIKLDLQMQSYNVVGVEAPENIRGAADNKIYSLQELEASIVENDLDFETVSETWNTYNVEGKLILKIKSSLVRVRKTNKFEAQGIPVYMYDFSAESIGNPIK
jgi:hypothetical protein